MSGEIEPIKQADNGIIPGLNRGNSRSYDGKKKPTLGIFAKGQYDKSGLSGGLTGLAGNMPVGKNGNMSAYVGGGNIFQLGAEYSHKISFPKTNNKLSFVGSAGLEGTVSFTSKSQQDFIFSDTKKSRNDINEGWFGSHLDGLPFDGQIIWEGEEVIHPDVMSADINHIVSLSSQINSHTSVKNSVSLPNNQIKGVLKGELRYGDDNFYVGAGVKLDAKTKFVPITKYEFGDPHIDTNYETAVEYDNYHLKLAGHYDVSTESNHAWTYHHKNVSYSENVELNNINFSDSQNTKIILQKPSFSVSPLITLGGKKGDLAGTVEADLEGVRVVGCYSVSKPFTSAGPHKYYRQFSNHNQAEMRLSLSGQSEDDINSVTVNLEGEAPINDRGTSINAGFGAGNAVSGRIGLNQDFQVGDNFTANIGLGAKGTISLKDNDKYVSEYSSTASTSDLAPINVDLELVQGEYDTNLHMHNDCTYNNNAYSTVYNSITVPRHNTYAYGTTGLTFTNNKKNFSAGINAIGGVRGKVEPYTKVQNGIDMQHDATYTSDPYFICSSGIYMEWVDSENLTEITSATDKEGLKTIIEDNIQCERDFNSQTNFKPTINPFAGVYFDANYMFKNSNWSIDGQVGTSWDFGQETKNNGINFKVTGSCRVK